MPDFRIINTVGRSFGLIKRDPTLLALFVLPAIFPAGTVVTTYLSELMFFHTLASTELPAMRGILFSVVGFLFEAWASAGAVLKAAELEKGSKLGLGEALYRGLKKVPRLLVPLIVSFAITTSMSAGLTLAVMPHLFTGVSPSPQGVIGFRLAMAFLFVTALYAVTRLQLYAPASVLESNFGLKTSWKLVKGNWWRLFAIILVFEAISAVISLIPVVSVFFAQVRAFFASLIVGSLLTVAMTLAYLKLREAKLRGEKEEQPL